MGGRQADYRTRQDYIIVLIVRRARKSVEMQPSLSDLRMSLSLDNKRRVFCSHNGIAKEMELGRRGECEFDFNKCNNSRGLLIHCRVLIVIIALLVLKTDKVNTRKTRSLFT